MAGLAYICSSPSGSPAARSGSTDAQGQFEFVVGQGCTFKVGNVTVGTVASVPGDNIVTPQDLAGVIRSATSSPAALAIAQFLQSLDDGSVAGTLTIPASVTTALNGVTPTAIFSNASGVLSQPALLALVRAAGKASLVSPTAATAQLQQELNSGRVKAASGAVTASSPVVLSSLVIGDEASLAAGLRGALTATGHYSDGSTKDLTASATWSSTSASVATVSAGSVLGLAPGSTTVTAQAAGVTGTASVQVGPPVLQGLALSPASPSVVAGRSTTLVLTGTYSDCSKGTVLGSVNWSSSAPATASVDAAGKVTGAATGSATITAAIGSLSTSLQVTVLEPEIVSIVISAVSNAVQVGSTLVLTALANLTNDTQKNVTTLVTWVVNLVTGGSASEATAVATVTTNPAAGTATLTGMGVGNVSVTASYQGLASGALGVEVSGPFATKPVLSPDLEPIYASFCLPPAYGRDMRVIPMDLNRDGRMDLLLFLWCSAVAVGTDFAGPMPSRLVALIQDTKGNFVDKTTEVFGATPVEPGGHPPENYVLHDFNQDGYPDVVMALNREDGRLIKSPSTNHYARSMALMSQGNGQYRKVEFGEPHWGFGIVARDNDTGGRDVVITSASRSSEGWTFDRTSGWKPLPGFDWVGTDSLFLPRTRADAGSTLGFSTSLSPGVGVSIRRLMEGNWVQGGSLSYPTESVLKQCCGNPGPTGAQYLRLDGKDYINPSFGLSCPLRRSPSAEAEALFIFNASEIVGGYNGQVVVEAEGVSTIGTYRFVAFGAGADGSIVRNPLTIRNELTQDLLANGVTGITCADVNGDGLQDIVFHWSKSRQTPVVYLNDGKGGFDRIAEGSFPKSPDEAGFALSNYLVTDLDGDGIPELVYFPIHGNSGFKLQLRIHKGLRALAPRDVMR